MNIKHYLYLTGGFIAVATAVNFAVGAVPQLNSSNTVTSLNALLQKANPLYYAGVVTVPAIPAT